MHESNTTETRPRHRVDLVRPGPVGLAWLRSAVAELQADDPLRPVAVVVPSPYVGLVARRALAEGGSANVRTLVLRQLAAQVAGPIAHRNGALTGVREGAAIRAALRGRDGTAFGELGQQRSLQDALAGLFRELRHQADPEPILAELEARGGVSAVAATVFRRFAMLTGGYYDVPELARRAGQVAAGPPVPWLRTPNALVVYLPPRLDPAEVTLLGQLGRRVPILAAFAHVGDELADRGTRQEAAALAAALGTSETAPVVPIDRPSADPILTSAPDPTEEVRLALRSVAADLEAGLPLWRIGLLYGQAEPYAALLRESLDAAGLPWHAAEGRPVAASWTARSLLGLLALRERRFGREAVLEWLAGWPPAERQADGPLPSAPISAWDRLSRQAQVLEGPRQWVQRFELLAARLEQTDVEQADRAAQAGEEPLDAPRDSAHARAIASAITQLERDTRPPEEGAPWDRFVEWAVALRARYLPAGTDWPAWELAASEAVDAALESLREAAALETSTTLATFRGALAAALEERRQPEGTPGLGVLVGPIGAALGIVLERVYVLGLAEGIFPARPSIDPLVATDDGGDPLGRRERRREADRRALLGALAAADGGRVALSYPRSDGAARELHPSRWLLELAGQREGRPVYASELPRLFGRERPWLVRVDSAYHGVARLTGGRAERPPADLHDRRLAGVVAWAAAGGDLARHPLAERADLPLGAALRAARARHSRDFTAYDGNLSELVGRSRRMARAFGGGHASATAVERWAGCPFQHLLQDVLRVQATQRPEEEWTINPLDRGLLVHRILEAFFRELHAAGRLGPDDPFTPADHARLEALALAEFAALEAQGSTGHPLAWENSRAAILADLHTLLEKDAAWRREQGLQPAFFERSFGDPEVADPWPAAVVLVDGRPVAFRGLLDRVDLSPPDSRPRQALIIDYKTGSDSSYKGLNDQSPLLDGRHVQLALYARALRAAWPESEQLEVQAEFRFVSSRGGFNRLSIQADKALDAELDRVVRTVAGGVGSGVFLAVPGKPDRGSFANCHFCDYDRVCATDRDEAWERKCRQPGALVHLDLAGQAGSGESDE